MRITIAFSLASMAAASPLGIHLPKFHALEPRQNSTVPSLNCADAKYESAKVKEAADASCQFIKDGEHAGNSKYPAKFNNREGFNLPVDGPYMEIPIMIDGDVYDGGSPGADRIILNQACDFAGGVTHDGADGNGFVECI